MFLRRDVDLQRCLYSLSVLPKYRELCLNLPASTFLENILKLISQTEAG
jgi:hypothetical protein